MAIKKSRNKTVQGDQSKTKTPTLEDVNAALESKMLELEGQLQIKTEKLLDDVKMENFYRQKLVDYEDDLKDDKNRQIAVCTNWVRQHKALQSAYMSQLNAENTVFQGEKREFSERTNLLKQLCANRDKELLELDACLKVMKMKTDRISEEFGRLLTEIQVLMAHRINSPLLDRSDQLQHFNDALESSKADYFKKMGEFIREREEKYVVGTS